MLHFRGRSVPVFTLFGLDRNKHFNNGQALRSFDRFISLTEKSKFSGILLPESNAGFINPWVFAQLVLSKTKTLQPFVAVNPLYTHPFFTAKYISNFALIFKRRTFVNYITGASGGDSETLGDGLTHDEKYKRVTEYIQLVDLLLSSSKVTFKGSHYNSLGASLPALPPSELMPINFIAGSSLAASNAATATNSFRLKMAVPVSKNSPIEKSGISESGLHFGIIARPSNDESHRILNNIIVDRTRQIQHAVSINKTQSVWKTNLHEISKSAPDNIFSLIPFSSGNSDVPYLVGSYQEVASYILEYIHSGATILVIEIPLNTGTDEFPFCAKVLSILKRLLH